MTPLVFSRSRFKDQDNRQHFPKIHFSAGGTLNDSLPSKSMKLTALKHTPACLQ